MILHRAPFVVPVCRPQIIDGGVLVAGGSIQAVGRFADLRAEATVVEDHPETILTPPLVNCHCHLELAHLAELGKKERPADFTAWVRDLVGTRLERPEVDYLPAARSELAALEKSGVGLLADIGNLPQSAAIGEGSGTKIIFLREMLGLSQAAAQDSVRQMAADNKINFTAHAPYSCAALLLQALKQKARENNSLFSIHAAESLDEKQFLADGGGPLRDFVEEKGVWDNSFTPPGCGSIAYLERLGLLDKKTLCVHCVHLNAAEFEIIAARKTKICLCPGSNEFLGVGRAPLALFIRQGILPGLGTDSRASNPHCSIWEEMRILAGHHPDIDPALIFTMATNGGAMALGHENYAVLKPGTEAAMLAVSYPNGTEREIFDFLTNTGKDSTIRWIR